MMTMRPSPRMVAPEIPHNTGAAGRLALATGSTLHLVKPLGFSLDVDIHRGLGELLNGLRMIKIRNPYSNV